MFQSLNTTSQKDVNWKLCYAEEVNWKMSYNGDVNWKKNRVNWKMSYTDNGQFRVLLVVMLFLTFSLSALLPLQSNSANRVQPYLLNLSKQDPEARIGVIIQQNGQAAEFESEIQKLGGIITKDLSIINAVAAEIPAGSVPYLGQLEVVRWVSYDAPAVKQDEECDPDEEECAVSANLVNTTQSPKVVQRKKGEEN
jgi:hypothetical protein